MRARSLLVVLALVLVGCDRFDRSFGANGVVATGVLAATAVRWGDGIAILGTSSGTPALVRYDAEGHRDRSFGNDGLAEVPGVGLDAVGMATDRTGGFVLAGVRGGTRDGFLVARYGADGQLTSVTDHEGDIEPADVGIGADGTVAVVNRSSMHTALVRPDGRTTIVETRVGSFGMLAAVVVQPDGKVVVAGQTVPDGSDGLRDIVIVRYLPDGRVDTSFAWFGVSLVDLGGDDIVQDLALAPDGRIVLTSLSSLHSVTRQWALRLTPDGRADPAFGGGGRSRAPIDAHSEGRTVHVRPDGRVVSVGLVLGAETDLLTTQWLADGRPDTAWGDGGADRTHLENEQLFAGALLDDGRLLAAGSNLLVRYQAPIG